MLALWGANTSLVPPCFPQCCPPADICKWCNVCWPPLRVMPQISSCQDSLRLRNRKQKETLFISTVFPQKVLYSHCRHATHHTSKTRKKDLCGWRNHLDSLPPSGFSYFTAYLLFFYLAWFQCLPQPCCCHRMQPAPAWLHRWERICWSAVTSVYARRPAEKLSKGDI